MLLHNKYTKSRLQILLNLMNLISVNINYFNAQPSKYKYLDHSSHNNM